MRVATFYDLPGIPLAKSWCVGPESEFVNQCLGQIDPTGTWALVKSNWNKTLFNQRMDVFLFGPLPKVGGLSKMTGRSRTTGHGAMR